MFNDVIVGNVDNAFISEEEIIYRIWIKAVKIASDYVAIKLVYRLYCISEVWWLEVSWIAGYIKEVIYFILLNLTIFWTICKGLKWLQGFFNWCN